MFRIFLTIVFLTLCTQASAKTIRYEFDVVGSNIGFMDLDKFVHDDRPDSGPWKRADWQTGEREYYIRKHHPLGLIYGLGGKVILDVNILTESVTQNSVLEKTGSISCVSGFLCLLDPSYFHQSSNDALTYTTFSTSKYGNLFFSNWNDTINQISRVTWYSPAFPILSGSVPCDFEPNCYVHYYNEQWAFSIENLSRSVVSPAPAPVPLPATAWFLVMGLVSLGLSARNRTA